MPRVLVTAFKPYDCWSANASWLALVELTKDLPAGVEVTTRLYDVDFDHVREQLEKDLAAGFDFALFVGQAPGSARVQLEAIGINVGGHSRQLPDEFQPLTGDGPAAYRSALPLTQLARLLREAGIPAQVSYHAGTYLCNATLYLSHHVCALRGWRTKAAFVHLPLDLSQVVQRDEILPSLPASESARALRLLLQQLADGKLGASPDTPHELR